MKRQISRSKVRAVVRRNKSSRHRAKLKRKNLKRRLRVKGLRK